MKSATLDYGYEENDSLTDVISSFAVIGSGLGEILGPLFAGFLSEIIGIENCCTLAALMSFTFAVVFSLGTGIAKKWFKKRPCKNETLTNRRIVPE